MIAPCAATDSVPAAAEPLGDPAPSTRPLHHPSETGHRHCILLIDDHFVVRAALNALLTILGCHVMDTGTAAEALKFLHGGLRPCLIFLEPGMPRGSAWLFRTFQLADPQLAAIPVAILSAGDRCPATAGELRVGHWLVKPPDAEEMVRLAASYCGAGIHHRENEDRSLLDITSPAS